MNDNIVCGINTIASLMHKNPESILEIYVLDSKDNKRILEIIDLAAANKIHVAKIRKDRLDALVNFDKHQGIAAKIQASKEYTVMSLAQIITKAESKALILVLDGVQDPHNLGACLRTAAAAAVDAVIIPKDNSVGITPVVRKVASGGAETVPIIRVTNLVRCLEELQALGVWVVGTIPTAEQNIFDVNLTGSVAIVLGAEGTGIRDLTLKNCDYLAKIPMQAELESLNVSVAAGICLFEAIRQRIL
jgi:23S rRNA (guanosine2251-2'-O)-methyltransferase